jgi:fatty acid desaturase
VTYWLLPKLAGDPLMMVYVGTQHFEMKENTPDLRDSTRSIKPNRVVDLFYWNMSYHVEHHLYPTVPFHALPRLNAVLREKLPRPKGLWAINLDIARALLDRHRQSAPVSAE